jgi:mono/diheme cytochrome c family protein
MKRAMRRLWGAGAALMLVAVVIVGSGLLMEQRRLSRSLEVPVRPLLLPAAAGAREHGRYLYESRGCASCHGLSGEGHRFADKGGVLLIGPDITPGGSTARYTEADWVRAVRHGVAPGGRPLRVMPSQDYIGLSDPDLAALVVYLQSLPAAGGAPAVLQWPLPVRLLYGFGLIDDAADRIDHAQAPEAPVAAAISVAHGRYLAQGCTGCHGVKLQGGPIPGGAPDWPAAPALRTDTPGPASGGAPVMARYADLAAFRSMMKTGLRPDGSAIVVMPFDALARYNEVDLQALHLYLQSPPH